MQIEHLVKPCYDEGGFSSLPTFIKNAFQSRQYETVILCLADGFGWHLFQEHQDTPFVQFLSRHGQVRKIVSQFPSTTSAHVTTLHSGLSVGQHGVFEWFYYEPVLDAMIAPLLFSRAGEVNRDTLKSSGVDPGRLYPAQTLYQELAQLGVASHVFQHREIVGSVYSRMTCRGAHTQPYRTLPEVLVNIGRLLENQPQATYALLYFDRIDAISHAYGPHARQTTAEITSFLHTLAQFFQPVLEDQKKRTLFLLTADHGQSAIDPATTIYLNRDARFSGIERFLKVNRAGQMLVPAGSCRDMFLYIYEDRLEEAQAFLSQRLQGKADVVEVQTIIEDGFFGPPPTSAEFLSRAGNLVILPHPGESVWWYEEAKFVQKFYGQHGGLTPQEMEIPLCILQKP